MRSEDNGGLNIVVKFTTYRDSALASNQTFSDIRQEILESRGDMNGENRGEERRKAVEK